MEKSRIGVVFGWKSFRPQTEGESLYAVGGFLFDGQKQKEQNDSSAIVPVIPQSVTVEKSIAELTDERNSLQSTRKGLIGALIFTASGALSIAPQSGIVAVILGGFSAVFAAAGTLAHYQERRINNQIQQQELPVLPPPLRRSP